MKMYFEKKGEGLPLVLLHGWGDRGAVFTALADELSQHFTVFSLDLPGFGRTEEPPDTWGIYDYAVAVEAFLNEHHITRPMLLGHSFGGRIAVILAGKIPLTTLVLTGCAGIRPPRSSLYGIKTCAFTVAKKLLSLPIIKDYKEEIVSNYIKHYGSRDYNAASPCMKKVLRKVIDQDLTAKMRHITTPTLLIWGKHDTVIPLQQGERIHQLIESSALVVFENSGHYPFLDESKRFITTVSGFLSQ